jgi:hypothetical protein
MPGNEDDAIAEQFAGDRNRLIGVAEVVGHGQLDALAENATPGVELLDSEFGGAQVLLAEPGDRAGHRARCGDANLGLRGPRAEMTLMTSSFRRAMIQLSSRWKYSALPPDRPQCGNLL